MNSGFKMKACTPYAGLTKSQIESDARIQLPNDWSEEQIQQYITSYYNEVICSPRYEDHMEDLANRDPLLDFPELL